ncbi:MAG: acyl-CoA dehydrogenase [Deltaproteobacteria bacterium]|nr:acyl-CoA dehydrogenase family protein [Myxococcales bacterium]TDJ14525.1 MAG: acyl-CoA dehydrogenase [Deltaproteobacteria bacterium]
MAISFEPAQSTIDAREFYHKMAVEQMRPISRKYDLEEHAFPQEWVDSYWKHGRSGPGGDWSGANDGFVRVCVQAEELCWGDAALYLRMPTAALGGSAVAAAGTQEQKQKFLAPFQGDGPPVWGAMAITEPQAGSDAAAIQATAELDGDEWVLNGNKIFCTSGESASQHEGGFVVVWATIDRKAGRAGIKSFVVPAGTPGMKLIGLEKKLGIRASDTATLLFEDCRIPRSNLLGSAEVKKHDPKRSGDKGFKGAMATFDASRPIVAAMAVGVGRASLDFVKEELARHGYEVRYMAPRTELRSIERDVLEMEAELHAARLLTWRAASMMTHGKPNSLEASMAKAKAGLAVTRITQKAVEILGPPAYSKKMMVEKWMRDAKINDIFEGTQQINQLIVARRILNYSSSMLR